MNSYLDGVARESAQGFAGSYFGLSDVLRRVRSACSLPSLLHSARGKEGMLAGWMEGWEPGCVECQFRREWVTAKKVRGKGGGEDKEDAPLTRLSDKNQGKENLASCDDVASASAPAIIQQLQYLSSICPCL